MSRSWNHPRSRPPSRSGYWWTYIIGKSSRRMSRFFLGWIVLASLSSVARSFGSDANLADAAEKSDVAGMQLLLKKHADLNARQIDGMSALHWMAYHDDLKMARLLVKGGANVNATNRYGVSPLSLACVNG